jgi:hypothetical protein
MNVPMPAQISGELLSTLAAQSAPGKTMGLGGSAATKSQSQEFSKALLAAQSFAGPAAAIAPASSTLGSKTSPEISFEQVPVSDGATIAEGLPAPAAGAEISGAGPATTVPGKLAVLNTSALITKDPPLSAAAVLSPPDARGAHQAKLATAGKEKGPKGNGDAPASQITALQPAPAPTALMPVSEDKAPLITTAFVVPPPPATSAELHAPGRQTHGFNIQADVPALGSPAGKAALGNAGAQAQQSGSFAGALETAATPKPDEKTDASRIGTPILPQDAMQAKVETAGVLHAATWNGAAAAAAKSSLPATREQAQGAGQASATPAPGSRAATAGLSSSVSSQETAANVVPVPKDGGHLVAPVPSPIHDIAISPSQPASSARAGLPTPAAGSANPHSILDGPGTPTSPAREAVWQLSPNRVEAGFANGQNSWISVVAQRQDGHLTAVLQSTSVAERGTLEALLPQLSTHLAGRDFTVSQLGVSAGPQFEGGPGGQNQSPAQNQGQGQMAQDSKNVPVAGTSAEKNETTAVTTVNGSRISLQA